MKYRCHLWIEIYCHDGTAEATRDIGLPFRPNVGDMLMDLTGDPDALLDVVEVAYGVESEMFFVDLLPDDRSGDESVPLSDVVMEYSGWDVKLDPPDGEDGR